MTRKNWRAMSVRAHRVDWIQAFALCLFLPAFLETLSPNEFKVSLTDPSVLYPKLPDIVPSLAVLLLAFVIPIAVFFASELCRQSHNVSTAASVFVLGLLEANGLTVVVTNALKLLVGRPRPYFAAVCQEYVIGSTTTCTGDVHKVAEARKSFPSGHSSLSFSAATYLCAYLAPVVRLGAPSRGDAKAWKIVVLLAPPLTAALVAVSRTIDYHHHFSDIIAGSLIGTGIAGLAAYNRIGDIDASREAGMHQAALPVVSLEYEVLEQSPK